MHCACVVSSSASDVWKGTRLVPNDHVHVFPLEWDKRGVCHPCPFMSSDFGTALPSGIDRRRGNVLCNGPGVRPTLTGNQKWDRGASVWHLVDLIEIGRSSDVHLGQHSVQRGPQREEGRPRRPEVKLSRVAKAPIFLLQPVRYGDMTKQDGRGNAAIAACEAVRR